MDRVRVNAKVGSRIREGRFALTRRLVHFIYDFPDPVPHIPTTTIHIPVWIPDNFCVRSYRKPVQNHFSSLKHQILGYSYVPIQPIKGRFNKHSIVYRRYN